MLDRLLRFLGPPPGRKEAGTVRIHLLSRVLNVHLLVALSVVLFYRGDRETQGAVTSMTFLTIPLALALRVLLHRGMSRLATWIFLISLSLTIPGIALHTSGSVALVSVSVFQMMLIVMAGLLLGGPEAIAFAALIVAGNGGLFWMEASTLPTRVAVLKALWILQAVSYIATGALLARAVALIEEAFEAASREARERQTAEEALRVSVERYRLITAVSSDYTFSTMITEGQGLRLNWVAGAFEGITGFTFDEYVARGGWAAALHPDHLAQDARDLEILKSRRPVASELRTIRRDGSVRWVRIYAHPVWDETNNRLSGIYGAVQDIDARKQAEVERESLIRELEARNAELERFTYTVSHDLKSPLITIRGFLGHIEQAVTEGRLETIREDMDRVHKATTKMHHLLGDLLDLSRAGRLAQPPERVPFEAIVRDALDRTQGRLAERNVVVEVDEPLPAVTVDRERLVGVMQNLIENAAKFMGAQSEPRIQIGVLGSAGQPTFFVRDNGAGVEPQYGERIFNLFDKLDPGSAGTGVGLALVKRIIEVHDGRVWVESGGQGKGSTFLFTLGGEPNEPGMLESNPARGGAP